MKSMRWLIAIGLAAALAPSAIAQGGPPNLTPQQMAQLQAKRKAWETFRENHKHVTALQSTLMGFAAMQQDPRTRLNKAQARKVLPVLKAWRKKPVMSDAQALKVTKQLTASLTPAQLSKIAAAQSRRGRGGPGGPGGPGARRAGGGPGGGPGGPGGTRRFDISRFPDPKPYNPLNPNSLPFERMRTRFAQHLDQMTAQIAATAR
ncbi:MAG: hypothetical protein IT208_12360 [Chthonomonadales bacterium]|nr:hypothetical protein [Chthonomonadales bacterium]